MTCDISIQYITHILITYTSVRNGFDLNFEQEKKSVKQIPAILAHYSKIKLDLCE